MPKPTCNRCGKCCYIYFPGIPPIKCRYLLEYKNGKTYCRIYRNRLGVDIGMGHICVLREFSPHDFEGCPLNTDKKIIA